MHRHLNNLTQVHQEMQDRYGSDDPVVLQLKEAIARFDAVESLPPEARLPFGERRSRQGRPSYWNVKLRHAPNPGGRRDVMAECTRVESRLFTH
jgi:hypothetical protein